MQGPVSPLSGSGWMTWNLDETIIETEVVSQGVLPAGRVGFVVGEPLHDELVNL